MNWSRSVKRPMRSQASTEASKWRAPASVRHRASTRRSTGSSRSFAQSVAAAAASAGVSVQRVARRATTASPADVTVSTIPWSASAALVRTTSTACAGAPAEAAAAAPRSRPKRKSTWKSHAKRAPGSKSQPRPCLRAGLGGLGSLAPAAFWAVDAAPGPGASFELERDKSATAAAPAPASASTAPSRAAVGLKGWSPR